MRTLKFVVTDQIITKDANCDFSGLVPGTEGYVQAKFSFSPEWRGCVKVASFYSPLGREYEPQILKDGETCEIPAEALKKKMFKVKVTGRQYAPVKTLITNKVAVMQDGGNE